MNDDQADAVLYAASTFIKAIEEVTEEVRQLLNDYGIMTNLSYTARTEYGFQAQIIDSTLVTIDDSVKALPVPNSTTRWCREMDNDEPL